MEYDSVGRFNIEKAKEILRTLRRDVPHIYWELGWSDGVLSDAVKYTNICVPEFQRDEAEYVIGLLENGEDLSDYQPDNRYPVLFEEVNGSFQVIRPLTSFAENVRELILLLDGNPEEDMADYLRKITQILLNIYALQFYLPECTGGSFFQPLLGFSLSNKFEPFLTYYDVSDPFAGQVDAKYLDKTLEEIVEVLQTGLAHYEMAEETGNYKYYSMAVSVWKNQYYGAYGWGIAVINSLKVLHYAAMYLEEEEHPESKDRQGS